MTGGANLKDITCNYPYFFLLTNSMGENVDMASCNVFSSLLQGSRNILFEYGYGEDGLAIDLCCLY